MDASKHKVITWEEIVPFLYQFTVWSNAPELPWFKKSWKGLIAAGITSYSNDVEKHWVYIRAITLGIMYGGYCHLEWDECYDERDLIRELYWDDELDQDQILNMLGENIDLNDIGKQDAFCSIVIDSVDKVKFEVYDALVKEFGDPATLYVGLFISRERGNDQENLDERFHDAFDGSYSPKGRDEAFQYVCASMYGIDAW